MKTIIAVILLSSLCFAHDVFLVWNSAYPGSTRVITRIYRTSINKSTGQCSNNWHLKFGTRNDQWYDFTALNGAAYCYMAVSYDKGTGLMSVVNNPIVTVQIPKH